MHRNISLKEFIEDVRAEILDSIKPVEESVFELEDLELEVSFALEFEAGGKAKFFVVGAEAKASGTQTHKVKLKLRPLAPPRQRELRAGRQEQETVPDAGRHPDSPIIIPIPERRPFRTPPPKIPKIRITVDEFKFPLKVDLGTALSSCDEISDALTVKIAETFPGIDSFVVKPADGHDSQYQGELTIKEGYEFSSSEISKVFEALGHEEYWKKP
jgi:hypothetical protein